MANLNDFDPAQEDGLEIDIMKYVRILLREWKRLLKWAGIGLVAGLLIVLCIPKTYRSKTVVAPELLTRNSASNFTSVSNLLGLSSSMIGVTDAMHTDIYPSIVTSTQFIVGLFDEPVSFVQKDTLVNTTVYEYFRDYTRAPWWSHVMSAPFRFLGWAVSLFKPEKEEGSGDGAINPIRLTKEQASVASAIRKSITTTVEKKTYLFTVSVETQNRDVSSILANAITEHLKEFVINYRADKNRESVEYFEALLLETREDYLEKQREYALYMDTHQSIVTRSGMVEQQNLQNEMDLSFQLFNQTSKNLMSAKAKMQQHSPVLVVIQPGMVPLRGGPSKMKYMLAFAMLAVIACAVKIIIRNA